MFLRQPLRQERGVWSELTAALHVFLVSDQGEITRELSSHERATLVRALQNTVRVKSPDLSVLPPNLTRVESHLMQNLRRPTDDEIAAVCLNIGRAYIGLRDYGNAKYMFGQSYKALKNKYEEGTETFILKSYILKKEMAELEALERLKK